MELVYQEEAARIAHKIKSLRLERKMTAQELAYRCNMERSNISRIESGHSNLTLKTLCSLCNALGISLRDLVR